MTEEIDMSDAPETIYAKHLGLDDASWWVVPVSGATEYRRADLTPTPAQIMAHPKVMALVDAGEVMAKALRGDYIVPKSASNWRAALAALETKP